MSLSKSSCEQHPKDQESRCQVAKNTSYSPACIYSHLPNSQIACNMYQHWHMTQALHLSDGRLGTTKISQIRYQRLEFWIVHGTWYAFKRSAAKQPAMHSL